MAFRDFLQTLAGQQTDSEMRKRRASEWTSLYERGVLTPEDYQAGAESYIQTGIVPSKPTGLETREDVGTKMVSQRPGGPPVVSFPTTVVKPQMEQIPLGKPMFTINKETGATAPLSGVPRNAEVLPFDPTIRAQGIATAYFVDKGGKVVKSMPIRATSDQFLPLSKFEPNEGRTQPETPQQKAARQVLAEYDRALKGGKGVSAELGQRAVEAARFLGFPTEITEGDPATAWERLSSFLTLGYGGQWLDRPGYERPSFGLPEDGQPGGSGGSSHDRSGAIKWLSDNGAPVTEANIQAVIKKGLGQNYLVRK